MKQYRYVIVSSQGASLDLAGGMAETPTRLFQPMWYHDKQYQELQELLGKGWRPVRETGMGGGSGVGGAVIAFALILLEREKPDDEIPVAQPAEEGITRET
ncbi:MAG TPA: hypothetical protein VJ739_19395 [Gemmataceae bacterium]|nr:hypothetical protein [Gemmataceae bacterium]